MVVAKVVLVFIEQDLSGPVCTNLRRTSCMSHAYKHVFVTVTIALDYSCNR